jgi:hypothetical protein
VIVLKSLGKNFGLHGIRFGYMVSNPAIAGRIRKALPKWNLNSFAEVVVFLLKEHQEEYHHSLRLLARDRKMMFDQLSQLPGLTVLPSQGNFLMVKLPDGRDGVDLRDYLISEFGVYVRECGNKLGSSSQFLRLVVRPQPDVQRLLNGLFAFLYGVETLAPQQQPQHQPAIALQRPVAVTEADAQWAAAVADIAASRPVTVADILAARPVTVPETRAQRPPAVNAQRPVAITDTDAQWQATVTEIAAARPAPDIPARSGAADVVVARPAGIDTGQWQAVADRAGRSAMDETGMQWPVADLASARPAAIAGAAENRSSRPTVADIGGGRPTVADVNARSGYGQIGLDDFSLAPKHARDQGPGTDWITIQRRGNTA